jgi:serpin B
VPAETVAVLVSAIYFKANWVIEFTPTPLMFWNGATWVEVAGMSVIGSHIKVVETEDYVAVEIPYNETSISMVIVMPSNFTRAIEKYREIIQGALRRLDEAPSGRSAYLVMPKFNITSYFDLKAVLMELGIREVFEEGIADLTRMANVARGAIFVSDVIHQAVIRVNEKGTEAAAATAIIIIESAPHYEVEVIINKPFFYILRDRESKVILFIGHVVDPSASS